MDNEVGTLSFTHVRPSIPEQFDVVLHDVYAFSHTDRNIRVDSSSAPVKLKHVLPPTARTRCTEDRVRFRFRFSYRRARAR